ncbi:MAG: nucleotidyltransferase domain-containing protein [Chitinophagales bacterium]|nr:nucleotidyltransferase domain-containing protein [Chitinophagaceae bacterium]MCB9064024.1 nucleotidyltransferase domain-containing protein [Chitinophagales bacterium]
MQQTVLSVDARTDILETLRYFHYFRHPLYAEEIHKFLGKKVDKDTLTHTLSEMVSNNSIYTHRGMYSLADNESVYVKRLVGADVAKAKIADAKKSAAIISNFPFVKGICISGSLSKGYADENSDIDFFIITDADRLWICRSFLHIFKKLTFLVNKEHSFCMNYFIDESRMCLDEKNVFTATEIVTLLPIYNMDVYTAFQNENRDWVKDFFPNTITGTDTVGTVKDIRPLKKIFESIFNILFPRSLNRALMNLTDTLWRKKWSKKGYPMEDYDLAMKTKWYVSKHHPLNYQKKVLSNISVAS